MVAKPDAGVGALDTFRLDNDADLDAFFSAKPDVDNIMEAFVQGTIVSFDGLADANGDLVFYTGHRFSQGIMETVNQARHIHYTSLRDIPPALEKAGRQCVRAFEVRERFFHIEFFETDPGKLCGPGSEHAPAGRLHHRHVQLCLRHRRLSPVGAGNDEGADPAEISAQIPLLLRQPQKPIHLRQQP